MAFTINKDEGGPEILVGGFERGVQPSPHKGIASIKNANLATETNEIMASFARTQQSQVGTTSSGSTFANVNTNTLSYNNASFTLTAGVWINISASTISGLATGDYYVKSVSGTSVQLAPYYNGTTTTGMGASGSATFTLKRAMGQPIADATEPYTDSNGVRQYRYYILDSQGLVWVQDSALTSSTFKWFLPDASITYFGSDTAPSGIAVLNGWLMVFSGNKIWVKPVVSLGNTTATTTTWEQMTGAYMNSLKTTANPHFAISSRQGSVYYTDGNYIGKIFPNSALQGLSGVNIQSFASYTAATDTGTLTNLINGSIPWTADANGSTERIPVVFFCSAGGTLPTNITADQVYFLEYTPSAQTFNVYNTESASTAFTIYLSNTNPGDTSSTIQNLGGTNYAPWPFATQVLSITFEPHGEVRDVTFTNGSSNVTWTGGLAQAEGAQTTASTAPKVLIGTGGSGTQYFNTFYPKGSYAGAYGSTPLMTFTPQRLNLPVGEVAKSMAEVGNQVLIGAAGSVVYPWDQVATLPSTFITLPEEDTQKIITVNQVGYLFTGYKGNIYVTDGSLASLALKVPDYCAGVPGTAASYIEPVYKWGGAMYLRGRVYFSILDQTASKAGQCGGVWSFYPTQNLAVEQDTGLSLRLENRNSYGTYNGMATVLIPSKDQNAIAPQYWAGWYSSVSSPLYGIDFTSTTSSSGYTFETDLMPVGTMLEKKTFSQIEYKLAAPLAVGEGVQLYIRANGVDAYASLGTAIVESTTGLSGYFNVNVQNMQWAQIYGEVTTLTNALSSFGRLTGLRLQ